MTAQPISENQQRQPKQFLKNSVVSAVQDALEQVVPELDKDGMQLVIEGDDLLKAAIKRATISALKQLSSRYPMLVETNLLKPVAKATVPARTKPFNVAGFYQTGTGLYVHAMFADRLDFSARKAVDSVPERPYVALLLKEKACEKDIHNELPKNHLSTLEDIAGLIEAQPNGKSGFLQNNGDANIFNVEGKNGKVFVVNVDWDSGNRMWFVLGWEPGEHGKWRADTRVLCPGNAAL